MDKPEMSREKTKFKYLMGLWKSMPDYPTKEDFKYEVSVYLAKQAKGKQEFSEQILKSVFGSGWENNPPGELFKSMIDTGEILESGKSTQSKKIYTFKD